MGKQHKDRVQFYEVALLAKNGAVLERTNCVGTYEQVESWAAKECSAYGTTYSITYLAAEKFNGVKNLTTY